MTQPRRHLALFATALLAAAALFLLAGGHGRAEDETTPRLGLPLDCIPGQTCWIVNYVDHDPGEGVRDYNCGTATYNAPPTNRHEGTDIAIRDLAAMRLGVPVLAAAAGKVVSTRNDMRDVSVREIGVEALDGKDCGNGVRIQLPGGWTTQYCHMRRGSVSVRTGETVAAGQAIGLVGLSGSTEYPHVHLDVNKGGNVVDPFVGLTRSGDCGLGDRPLWNDRVLALLPYGPTALYNVGFATEKPTAEGVRDGRFDGTAFSRLVPVLILWVDIFQIRQGDELTLSIAGPDGKELLDNAFRLTADKARYFRFAGIPRPALSWTPGTYRGVIRLHRGGRTEATATREISIR